MGLIRTSQEYLDISYALVDLLQGDSSVYRKALENIDMAKIKMALDFITKNERLSDGQKLDLISNSWRLYYRVKPPTPEAFLTPKYLGRMGEPGEIYPHVRKWFIEFLDPTSNYRNMVLYSFIGSGKAQPMWSKILTPHGWEENKNLKVGDKVCTPSGGISTIQNIFPQGERPYYKITLKDGRTTFCDEDHLWKISYRHKQKAERVWDIKTTKEILELLQGEQKYKKCRSSPRMTEIFIPLPDPVSFDKISPLPLNPYILGVLLGDGSLSEHAPRITCHPNDSFILDKVEKLLPPDCRLVRHFRTRKKGSIIDAHIVAKIPKERSSISKIIEALGLSKKNSYTKFIPSIYKMASKEEREELMKGLMDTDGYVSKAGNCDFSTASETLAKDFTELVRSLGGLAYTTARQGSYKKAGIKIITAPQHRITINRLPPHISCFALPRKKDREEKNNKRARYGHARWLPITSIEYQGTTPTQCLLIDDPEHLYITDDFIVTHNSTLSVLINLYLLTLVSLMRDPKKFFGLAPSTVLACVLCSYSLKKSSETLLEPFLNLLECSGYFVKCRTKEDMIKAEDEYQKLDEPDHIFWSTASIQGTSALTFSNNMNVKLISSVHNLLGLSIVCGTMTELAFFREAGKALTLDSKVLTPTGYTLMKDIKIGDEVLTHKGTKTKVIDVLPQGKTRVFELTFSDGRTIKANPEHEWMIKKDRYWYKKTTQEIFEGSTNPRNMWGIPLPLPSYFEEKSHFISPYILGFALGDGSFRSNSFFLSMGNDKDREESIMNIAKDLHEDYTWSYSGSPGKYIRIIKKEKNSSIKNRYAEEIIKLGLVDKRSSTKFIPKEYLYDSVSHRTELLQGLMDTDGSASQKGAGVFSTTSRQLAEDVVYLARSLGAFASISKQKRRQETYFDNIHVHIHFPNNDIPLFKMKRKQQKINQYWKEKTRSHRQILRLKSIVEVDQEETQCITIADEDHLFLANDFIVTSNSDEYIMRFFNDLKYRVESRMKDPKDVTGLNYFGRTILDSSPNDLESPIDQYCTYEAANDFTNYVVSGSRWKWVPQDFEDVKEWFPVFKGSAGKPPMVLTSAEGFEKDDIIWVPDKGRMKRAFIDDCRKALKDQAGIPSGNTDKLIYESDKIEKCFIPKLKNIYTCIKADIKDSPQHLVWNQIKDELFVKVEGKYRFYYKPTLPRTFHIDQAVSGDMASIAVAHVERKYDSFDEHLTVDGQKDLIYVVDFTIPIHPLGGRINLDAIKEAIIDLREEGHLALFHGSFDSYQSETNIQALERYGFEVENLSVDKTIDPYLFMIQLMEVGNLKMGRNIFLKNNIKSLRMIKRRDTGTPKIDHTQGDVLMPKNVDTEWATSFLGQNAKDVSDSVCGAVQLAKKYLSLDPLALTTKWDEERIIISKEHVQKDTGVLLKNLGFAADL